MKTDVPSLPTGRRGGRRLALIEMVLCLLPALVLAARWTGPALGWGWTVTARSLRDGKPGEFGIGVAMLFAVLGGAVGLTALAWLLFERFEADAETQVARRWQRVGLHVGLLAALVTAGFAFFVPMPEIVFLAVLPSIAAVHQLGVRPAR